MGPIYAPPAHNNDEEQNVQDLDSILSWEVAVFNVGLFLSVAGALGHTGFFISVCASMSSSCLMSLTQEA